jgi:hypothetical protein
MIAFAIHTALWHMSGKEVVEAHPQDLTVTKQVFRWKWSKIFASNRIHNLRTNTEKLSMDGGESARFTGIFRGLELVPSKRRYLVPPTSG